MSASTSAARASRPLSVAGANLGAVNSGWVTVNSILVARPVHRGLGRRGEALGAVGPPRRRCAAGGSSEQGRRVRKYFTPNLRAREPTSKGCRYRQAVIVRTTNGCANSPPTRCYAARPGRPGAAAAWRTVWARQLGRWLDHTWSARLIRGQSAEQLGSGGLGVRSGLWGTWPRVVGPRVVGARGCGRPATGGRLGPSSSSGGRHRVVSVALTSPRPASR